MTSQVNKTQPYSLIQSYRVPEKDASCANWRMCSRLPTLFDLAKICFIEYFKNAGTNTRFFSCGYLYKVHSATTNYPC